MKLDMRINVKLNMKLSVRPTMRMFAEQSRILSVIPFKKLNANRKIVAIFLEFFLILDMDKVFFLNVSALI